MNCGGDDAVAQADVAAAVYCRRSAKRGVEAAEKTTVAVMMAAVKTADGYRRRGERKKDVGCRCVVACGYHVHNHKLVRMKDAVPGDGRNWDDRSSKEPPPEKGMSTRRCTAAPRGVHNEKTSTER